MGQGVSACLSDCWSSCRGSSTVKPTKKQRLSSTKNVDVQQPLVVEDESWKKWSSYNLIHAKDKTDEDSRYNPPVYLSQGQHEAAEAVWDL